MKFKEKWALKDKRKKAVKTSYKQMCEKYKRKSNNCGLLQFLKRPRR